MASPDPTYDRALEVLTKNVVTLTMDDGTGPKDFRHTVPSPQFYVHQWFWDSCTHAMALVHIDAQRAYDELHSLVAGQWPNGHIGAITYNPEETTYYSKVQNWHTDQFAAGEIKSTGITQPPLLAIAVEHVYRHSPDQAAADAFLDEILPAVTKYHDYLQRDRDPERMGLLSVIHPWESGLDNSPRWDDILFRMSVDDIPDAVKRDVDENRADSSAGHAAHRPTQEEYYKYMHLVHVGNEHNWEFQTLVPEIPFAIKDVLFNSLWIRANESLAALLRERGDERGEKYSAWAQFSRVALGNLWSDDVSQHRDLDVTQGRKKPVYRSTVSIFLPLIADAVDDHQLEVLLDRLTDPEEFWTADPVPSTALNSPNFELVRYWRGPTWPITNLFVIEGLSRYAQRSERAARLAKELTEKTLGMLSRQGLFEYYDPTRGKHYPEGEEPAALGFGQFSWSAAVYVYLKNRLPDL